MKFALPVTGFICLAAMGGVHAQANDPLLPPNAKAGECYARVFVPDVYETSTEQVLVQDAGEVVAYSAPKYEFMTQQQLVHEAYEKWDVEPAKFEWREEQVLVQEESEELKYVAAEYEWTEEKVLVRPAYTTWKRGRGLIERIDDATGEIMCRVEIPAIYDTVKKKILKAPARTEKVAVPAQYRTVKKRVMVGEPTLVKTSVPAKYADVKVRKVVSAAQAERSTTPARYETVTKTVKVADGRLEWRSVLCETNAGRGLVTDIQRALESKGYNPGPIDGVVGRDTMNAVIKFQEASSLSSGKLTLETIRALGVQPR